MKGRVGPYRHGTASLFAWKIWLRSVSPTSLAGRFRYHHRNIDTARWNERLRPRPAEGPRSRSDTAPYSKPGVFSILPRVMQRRTASIAADQNAEHPWGRQGNGVGVFGSAVDRQVCQERAAILRLAAALVGGVIFPL